MKESSRPIRIGIEGVSYSLTHVPDLVRYGSKPSREIRANQQLGEELKKKLRSFAATTAYAPHQVYIGNITPQELSRLPQPWYDKLIEDAMVKGRFGDLVDQDQFYSLLAGADQFNLVTFEENWFHEHAAKYSNGKPPRLRPLAEVTTLCEQGALRLYSGER